MDKKPCPFCGSLEVKKDTPFIDAFGKKGTTFCCKAQAMNAKYADKHRDASTLEKPDVENVAKW